jgi:hypothetical protein
MSYGEGYQEVPSHNENQQSARMNLCNEGGDGFFFAGLKPCAPTEKQKQRVFRGG